MFKNIGGKIKGLAIFLTIVGMIASVILGISTIVSASQFSVYGVNSGTSVLIGIVEIIVGCILSWIGSFVLYGFGQLVESIQNIEQSITGSTGDYTDAPEKPDTQYLSIKKSNKEIKINRVEGNEKTKFQDDGVKTGLVFSDGTLNCAFCGSLVEPGDSRCPNCKKVIDWNSVIQQ